jgi:hypothetical protein
MPVTVNDRMDAMSIPRRRLLQAVVLAGGAGGAADAQVSEPGTDALRNVSTFHGVSLSDERLGVLKPVLDRRLTQLRTIRSFEFDDTVGL